jgi:hypothetical protein
LTTAEQQLRTGQSSLAKYDYEYGKYLAKSGQPMPKSASPEMKTGYKTGSRYAAMYAEKERTSPTIITETRTVKVPTSLLTNVPMFAGGMKDTSATPVKAPYKYYDTRTPLQKLYLKQRPELQGKPFSLFGQIDIAAKKYAEPTFSFLQRKEEQILGKRITSTAPYQLIKSVRETKIPSPLGQQAQMLFFSPLIEVGAAKKGSKQVQVTEKETKKITSEQLRKAIQENAIRYPTANREAMIKLYEGGNKAAIKEAEQAMKDVLGKSADTLLKDAQQQSGYISAATAKPDEWFKLQKLSSKQIDTVLKDLNIKPISTKPVAEEAAQATASQSAYWNVPEYSFAEVQVSTSKAIGATPAQMNLKALGLVTGLKTSQTTSLKQEQGSMLKTSTITKQTSLQASKSALKSLQAPSLDLTSIQIPQLSSIQLPKTQYRTSMRTPTYDIGVPPVPTWKIVKPVSPVVKKTSIFGTKKSKAFQLFIKRKGRNINIGLPTTRGRALRTGESITRGTLARTFGLSPTSRTTEQADIQYTPSQMFRDYQIRKGMKISLQDTFIQRARFSLSSLGEKAEIKAARRNKIKWF